MRKHRQLLWDAGLALLILAAAAALLCYVRSFGVADAAEDRAATENFGKQEEAIKFAKDTVRQRIIRGVPGTSYKRMHARWEFGEEINARLDRKSRNWIVTGTLWDLQSGNQFVNDWKVIANYQPSERSWKEVGVEWKEEGWRFQQGPKVKGTFAKPLRSQVPVSSLTIVSSKGEFFGQGQKFSYDGKGFAVQTNPGGVIVYRGPPPPLHFTGDWALEFGGPCNRFLEVGEYDCAKQLVWTQGHQTFRGFVAPPYWGAPGIDIHRHHRGYGNYFGKFIVWEIEVKDNKVARLAIDFIVHGSGRWRLLDPPLCGSVRFNSSFRPVVPVPASYPD
jgi:hypothetical protein